MPPQLVALTEGPNILLDKPILLLGRHQECDIQLASRKISRRHCCIAQVHDYLVVRDLCSTNGIRINGVRVTEGCLKPGDELTLGNHRYQLQWHGQANEPIPSKAPAPVLPGKEAVRRTRHVPFEEEDQLESCEDPVPLPEPVNPGQRAGPVLPSAPVAPPAKPLPARSPSSIILPEDLQLAPLSDVAPPPDKPAEPPP
ncbi:MAG TPA: FHA domain-containing protein [Gemmataceae bacterium]|nr:FHA domain-containing protein [Gemmataceae bacterium]